MAVTEECEFWCVWTKTGHIPKFIHQTEAGAFAEAERLALKRPGKKFIVMRAYHKVHVPLPEAPAQTETIVEAAIEAAL